MGRDASPILDKYPSKKVDEPVRLDLRPATPRAPAPPAPAAPVVAAPARPAAPAPAAPTSAPATGLTMLGGSPGAKGLLSLEPPFDVDEFAQSLGENQLRVVVPREDLPEVLRRITDFMGFGIYVYALQVRPADEELLKKFVVELTRVDFSPEKRAWAPFEDKGRSDSPFGPTGTR